MLVCKDGMLVYNNGMFGGLEDHMLGSYDNGMHVG